MDSERGGGGVSLVKLTIKPVNDAWCQEHDQPAHYCRLSQSATCAGKRADLLRQARGGRPPCFEPKDGNHARCGIHATCGQVA